MQVYVFDTTVVLFRCSNWRGIDLVFYSSV